MCELYLYRPCPQVKCDTYLRIFLDQTLRLKCSKYLHKFTPNSFDDTVTLGKYQCLASLACSISNKYSIPSGWVAKMMLLKEARSRDLPGHESRCIGRSQPITWEKVKKILYCFILSECIDSHLYVNWCFLAIALNPMEENKVFEHRTHARADRIVLKIFHSAGTAHEIYGKPPRLSAKPSLNRFSSNNQSNSQLATHSCEVLDQ